MIDKIKLHFGFLTYTIILIFLVLGVYVHSGTEHLDKLAIVIVSFISFYLLQDKFLWKKNKGSIKVTPAHKTLAYYGLVGIALSIFVLDLIILKGLPGFRLFSTVGEVATTELRNNIHLDSHPIFVYLNSFNLKVFFPLAILFSFMKNQKWVFVILTLIGSVYCFGLLQKSYILSMLLPILMYFLLSKKYLFASGIFALIVINFTVIIIGSSGKIEDDLEGDGSGIKKEVVLEETESPWIFRLAYGISRRIIVVPGEMVSEWFTIVPKKMPYLYGAGYPIIPRLKGVEYVDYDKLLYPIIRPEYTERNIKGSVNVATFVREYANFGYWGLVISSLLLAVFIGGIEKIFRSNFKMFLIINLINLLYLSSANLWTLLFSGGWMLSIIIYFIIQPAQNTLSNDK